MIGATDLRGQNPIDTFQNLVTTAVDANGTSSIYNATGSAITYLSVTTSFARSASYEIIFEDSASHADFSTSGSATLYAKSASFSDFAKSGSYSDFAKSSSYGDFAKSGSYSDFAKSSSYADFTKSSSYAQTSSVCSTSSFIYPAGGSVSTTNVPTGSSAGTAGFTSTAELGQFILDVSSSVMLLNDLIAKLKLRGIIS